MATPERVQTSQRLRRAAIAERRRLARELHSIRERLQALRDELSKKESVERELQSRLEFLEEIAGADETAVSALELVRPEAGRAASVVSSRASRGSIRGSAIREVAVRLLAAQGRDGHEIHYGDWFKLVQNAGYEISARDPLGTFLTQISRSPVVMKAGTPGTYALDLGAPARLTKEVDDLREELAALHQGQQTIDAIGSVSERREELTRRLARTERALLEAVHSIGLEGF